MKGYNTKKPLTLWVFLGVLALAKNVIIIGGGIAGLAAGCYARMNGFETDIFEMHDKAGGLCTSWKRKGYVFDGSMHWLVGTREGMKFYDMWQELGAIQGRRVIYEDNFMQVVGKDGKRFVLYTDIDRLERHMKELAPADARVIGEIASDIRAFKKMGLPTLKPGELYTKLDIAKMIFGMLPVMGTANKYSKLTMKDLADRFTDPFLRDAVAGMFDMPGFPAIAFLVTMAWFSNGWQGCFEGGSLEFARGIEKRYLDLGGRITFRTKVEKVLVENDAAVGVRLSDGRELRADFVISACDGHETIYELLAGKYVGEKLAKAYGSYPVFPSGVQVSLGVARDLSAEPYWQVFNLETPVEVAGVKIERVSARHYCNDPTMAPKGKSAVISFYCTDYAYWKKLGQDRARYEAEKDKIAAFTIAELEKRYPGIQHQIEIIDVATPLTYERYTGNWQGSYMGWMNTPVRQQLGLRLPGLKHFYMAGMWTQTGGGVPTAAMTGRGAVEMLCREDGRKFTACTP